MRHCISLDECDLCTEEGARAIRCTHAVTSQTDTSRQRKVAVTRQVFFCHVTNTRIPTVYVHRLVLCYHAHAFLS